MRSLLLFTLALISLPVLSATELKPFSASYTADWKQIPITGTANRSLGTLGNDQWKLTFNASMLIAGLTEESTFRIDNQTIYPLSYRFERTGLGKAKNINHVFDWTQKRVTGKEREESIDLPLASGLLDKSTYQLVLQKDVMAGKKSMTYQVVDGTEIETYDFRVLGEESVSTKAGQLDAIKVERVRDPTQSQRKTVLWFAKDWGGLLVRLNQIEKDGKEYLIMLQEGEVDGKAVKGR